MNYYNSRWIERKYSKILFDFLKVFIQPKNILSSKGKYSFMKIVFQLYKLFNLISKILHLV